MKRREILLIEDNLELVDRLTEFFSKYNYIITAAKTGTEALFLLKQKSFDFILLDLMLPDVHGFELCKQIRGSSDIPIILLTATTGDVNRIMGLEAGADDYVEKPFNPHELLARVSAVLRRHEKTSDNKTSKVATIEFCGWRYMIKTQELVSPEGKIVELTGREIQLLVIFLRHSNQVLTRSFISRDLDMGYGDFNHRRLDTHISRLRKKFSDISASFPKIKSVRNQGYILTADVVMVEEV